MDSSTPHANAMERYSLTTGIESTENKISNNSIISAPHIQAVSNQIQLLSTEAQASPTSGTHVHHTNLLEQDAVMSNNPVVTGDTMGGNTVVQAIKSPPEAPNLAVNSEGSTDEMEAEGEDRFTLFPKLAAEIRVMIWKESLPGPRHVEIGVKRDNNGPLYYASKLIAHLEVNVEAREVALRYYEALIPNPEKLSIKIYFDPAIDTILFSPHFNTTLHIPRFFYTLPIQNKECIRRIAVMPDHPGGWGGAHEPERILALHFEEWWHYHLVHKNIKEQNGSQFSPLWLSETKALKTVTFIFPSQKDCPKDWDLEVWDRQRGGRYDEGNGMVLEKLEVNHNIPLGNVDKIQEVYPDWIEPQVDMMRLPAQGRAASHA